MTDAADDTLLISDKRAGWPQRTITLTGWHKTAYQELARVHTPAGLRSRLTGKGAQVSLAELASWLDNLLDQGLVFTDGGRWVALATCRGHAKLPTPKRWGGAPLRQQEMPGEACQLPADEQAAASFLARVRDALSAGTLTRWRGTIPRHVDTEQLHHLPPPDPVSPDDDGDGRRSGGAGDDARASRWRAAFRPGLCYYRMGPGFIQVKDVRDATAAARFTLDDAGQIELFLRCLRPVRLQALRGENIETARLLLSERLLMRFGDFVTTAPHRMRRWPIPARGV
jgi:hypothetical protein